MLYYNLVIKKFMKLTNKVIFITGASSGIGKSFAIKAAQDKCKLILTGRNIEKLQDVEKECVALGSEVLVVSMDVTSEDQIINAVNLAKDKFGNIDVLFNNAGLGFVDQLVNLKTLEIKTMIDTNITGMIMVAKYVLESMINTSNTKHIVFTSSIAGLTTLPQWSVYCATKWAITAFADSIRTELKKYNILITTVHPGPIKTDFFNRANINTNALGDYKNFTSPEDVANAVYNAIYKNNSKVIVPGYFKFLYLISKYLPFISKMTSNRFANQKYH